MNRYLIITVDTESDNQWDVNQKQSTENAKFVPRFQELCENYGFYPVYLVDYSMSCDPFLVEYLKNKQNKGLCEVGMHLHAWSSPPHHILDDSREGRAYITEYPIEVMDEKVKKLTAHLENVFGQKMISHRSGRWAINKDYISILKKYGYKVDCSVTPGINWEKQAGAVSFGPNYKNAKKNVSFLEGEEILEVPMTVRKLHYYSDICNDSPMPKFKELLKFIIGRNVWLRPAIFSVDEMLNVVDKCEIEELEYVELMIHSSELMPGGSPYFVTKEDVEKLYKKLEMFFSELSTRNYKGLLLKDTEKIHKNSSRGNKK